MWLWERKFDFRLMTCAARCHARAGMFFVLSRFATAEVLVSISPSASLIAIPQTRPETQLWGWVDL